VYLTGGATAVLIGWRDSTIDVNIAIVPDTGELLRAVPALKEELEINVELASPADFIPVVPGWEDRSPFIAQHGPLSFHHFDLAAQVLAKVERGHAQDRVDIEEMLARRLVTAPDLRLYFERIAPELYRFPAIDPGSFRSAVEAICAPGPRS
jgi:hypothetical protein